MRIESVKAVFPSRRVANEDVLALIRERTPRSNGHHPDGAVRRVAKLLRLSGAESRRWLGEGERPADLVERAVGAALAEAGCEPDDVDLVINASIDRAFIEPANAYFVAKAFGMTRAACFDVSDACNGWARAVELAQALLALPTYRRVLVVNAEFPMFSGGPVDPGLFSLDDPARIPWTFAAYTLGEGVAATLLTADPDHAWEFRLASRPALADLSTVPLPGFERYVSPSARVGRNGTIQVTAFSAEMFAAAVEELPDLVSSVIQDAGAADLLVPHAATARPWVDGIMRLGLDVPIANVFAQYGNVGSASIPAGLALAVEDGRLERGRRVVCLTASAGMAFGAISFAY